MKRFVSITLAVALFACITLAVASIVLHVGVADAQNKDATIAPRANNDGPVSQKDADTAADPFEPSTGRRPAGPRELAKGYIAAVLAGKLAPPPGFATGSVTNKRLTSKEWMDGFRKLLGAHSFDIETVRVTDISERALAVSTRIKFAKPLPDVGDTVRIVIQMSVDGGGGWVISDVDLWSESNVEKALARFNQQHPDAREIPAVRVSSTATSKVDALKHAKVRDAVEKAFEARQQQQRAELAKLQQRFQRIQNLIEGRERIKDKIIDRRVDELLNPALRWDTSLQDDDGTSPQISADDISMFGSTEDDSGNASNPPKSQVLFSTPHRMSVVCLTPDSMTTPLVCPVRLNMAQGSTHQLHLSNIPGYDGLDFYPTLEIRTATKQTESFLAHNSITVAFAEEDFEQALSGNLVTRVLFLPNHGERTIIDVDSLVSTQLAPDVDPIAEAERQGSIVAILRIGNRQPQAQQVINGQPERSDAPLTIGDADIQRATELRTTIQTLADEARSYEAVLKYNPKADNIGNITKKLQTTRRNLAIHRDQLAAQIQLLELELEDAKSAADATARTLEKDNQSTQSEVVPKSDINKTQRDAEAAQLRVDRLRTLLELYRMVESPENEKEDGSSTLNVPKDGPATRR